MKRNVLGGAWRDHPLTRVLRALQTEVLYAPEDVPWFEDQVSEATRQLLEHLKRGAGRLRSVSV